MISERFRKTNLTQDDLESIKHGLACSIRRSLLDQHPDIGNLDIQSPEWVAKAPIASNRLLFGMAMYAQVHIDNVKAVWPQLVKTFDADVVPILQETLQVTKKDKNNYQIELK